LDTNAFEPAGGAPQSTIRIPADKAFDDREKYDELGSSLVVPVK